ncbi:shikimate dehydrogenase [Arthrobacter gengyunqii]|uniref:Shikimate dehydrogenase n=1 Tax=Arthrobacter gengyunqii TaxID=2886940 RepID=A0A9X1M1U3_9MICC|nr:shikimate dehydrogenase [Arthrobacter gengyunqii]MCC3269122.1 shikimate dehydrogenase [Arthrobacter gengyunqii]UOY94913.1 shikimate dehydrogenase [Arthrobacter gengyunqii]
MTETARRAAVLGHPIGHSKSPLLHRAAYEYLGFHCAYDALDVPEENAAAFAAALRHPDPTDRQWAGLSVTMPLKAALLPAMDRLTEMAAALRVLNTVTFEYTDAGVVLTGHNTDVAGIVRALRHAGSRTDPRIAVLGAGGTACAAVAAAGMLDAAAVDVYARGFRAAADGTVAVQAAGSRTGTSVALHPWEEAAAACATADVVISTLPPRAADPLAESLAAAAVDRTGAVLLDVAYDPWPSRIAQEWSEAGGRIVPGLEMLLYQAVEQVRLFAGNKFRDEAAVINVMCDAVGAPRR